MAIILEKLMMNTHVHKNAGIMISARHSYSWKKDSIVLLKLRIVSLDGQKSQFLSLPSINSKAATKIVEILIQR